MVGPRRGASKLGCLFTVLVVTAVAYFAFSSGEVVLRYYRYRDAMEQEARFARHYTDEDIKKTIVYGGAAVGKSPNMPANPDLEGKPELDGLVKVIRGFKGK